MEMLSYQVLDPYPSRIDGEINGFTWGLRSTMERERERELLLYFECAEVRKKGAGWFITVGKERERYIYPQAPMVP